jgi:hypothetical protein
MVPKQSFETRIRVLPSAVYSDGVFLSCESEVFLARKWRSLAWPLSLAPRLLSLRRCQRSLPQTAHQESCAVR